MGDAEKLVNASSDAVLNAAKCAVKPCPQKPTVSPVIVLASPKIVLVKKAYQTKGHRLRITLGTDVKFTGTGSLSVAPVGQLRIFDAKGVEQALPLSIPGAQLSKGVTVYAEGISPSAGMNTTSVSLSLAGGDKTVVNSPATDHLTSVEVGVDLCQYKAAPAGVDPAPVPDKINTGRNLHVQNNGWAGRALLIVRQARPAAYTNPLVLKSRGGKVRTFVYANEVYAPGQAVQADPLSTPVGPAGLKLWVEGVSPSSKVLDTGFTLGISDLPGVEGDRANITVVQATLDVYDLPAKAGAKPAQLSAGAKMNPGRTVHLQDAGKNHGRAKVVIKRVKPSGWVGNLETVVWNVTANNAANPRLSLFTGEAAASLAHANPIAHPAGVAGSGKVLWAEGTVTSDGLMDTELRLRVTDAEGSADRGRFTVRQFFVREIRFNDPVAKIWYARVPDSGSFLLPPPADPAKKHFTPEEERPASGTAHWKKKAAKDPAAEFSWPAVYARRKATGVVAPSIRVKLDLFPKVPGSYTAKIKAIDSASGVKTEEKDVTFSGGEANAISFDLKGLPNTVKRLDGMEFQWYCDGPAHKTKHTLFILDTKPLAANNLFADQYLWEIFEWSCKWADGITGSKKVFDAIWAQFHPVKAAHDTGLVYWKNFAVNPGGESQNLADAIRSQEPTAPKVAHSASCIVFDRVLMNTIGAQGIPSAEVKLTPQTGPFTRGVEIYDCDGWHDTTTNGQGNTAAPPDWGSHWIAAVNMGGWKFYDASYGEGPVPAPTPGAAMSSIDVFAYEPRTVATFNCTRISDGMSVSLSSSATKAVPPHLVGLILWTNK